MTIADRGKNEQVSLSERVATEVRAYLARRRLSARQAAKQIGWTQAYISRRLTGAASFTVDDLDALAELLEVPVTAFFEGPKLGDASFGISDERGYVNDRYRTLPRVDLHSLPDLDLFRSTAA